MKLTFITLRDTKTGRASSLSIGGRNDNSALTVIGGLSHNAQVVPNTVSDADRLIVWLTKWRDSNPFADPPPCSACNRYACICQPA